MDAITQALAAIERLKLLAPALSLAVCRQTGLRTAAPSMGGYAADPA